MSIQCPNCHASRAHLEPITEHLSGGEILQTVRCILCGHRVSRRLLAPALPRRPQSAAKKVKPLSQRRREPSPNTPPMVWAPCAVVKCSGRHVPARERKGWPLCQLHRQQMMRWARTRQLTPPPLIEVQPGWWDVNPARTRAEQATQGGAPC